MPDRRAALTLRGLGVVAAIASGFLVTMFGALGDSVRVTTKEQLEGPLEYGFPFPWITQWTLLDPPLPYRVSMALPIDTVTDVRWSTFWLNVVVVTAAVGLILLSAAGLKRVVDNRRQ